jgi:hypothetical protein
VAMIMETGMMMTMVIIIRRGASGNFDKAT